ncbi:MAG: hypothetical protein D6730_13895 [Bacteroidetes bacterium]|nr:MAG: hypothetical protein D6730_13895 [Bacteroidota bacterium]
MDLVKILDQLEDKYYEDPENQKAAVIAELLDLHMSIDDEDTLNRFCVLVAPRCGGIYIPYIFWDKLAAFLESEDQRAFLQEIISAFTQSDFEEEEQRKMKPLLITYMANEKQFEIDKLKTLIIDKAHPTVREYFNKLINFVRKNVRSTKMYSEKFEILKDIEPNFELLSLPITQLKEKFQRV